MQEKKDCRSCWSTELELVFSLGEQTLSSFLAPGQSSRMGPLDLMMCRACGLIQLRHVYPGDWFYNWYGYRSGTNPLMVKALGELALAVQMAVPLGRGDAVLDIGSNDGTFLRGYQVPGLIRAGVDPVKNLDERVTEGLDLFINDYFSAGALATWVRSRGRFKAVTANAMFYELEDQVAFLADVAALIDPSGILVIQMNSLPSMLERNGYDNIVHEHQTYDSLTTLLPTLERGGFKAFDVEENDVNGGSFRVWATPVLSSRQVRSGSERLRAMLESERMQKLGDPATYIAFGRRIRQLRDELREVIMRAVEAGKKVYVYGASTRGLAIMEYTGLRSDLIAGAAERNPDKWGRTYAATGILCVPEEEARKQADYFLALPHHFIGEFVKREAEWLEKGGEFIVPLPSVRTISTGGLEWKPAAPATAAAYGEE